MKDRSLFLQTARQIDFVDVFLCCKLYDICNDNLIAGTSRSNFVCWLNLRPTDPPILLLPREKTRLSYFIKEVSEHLIIKQFKNDWISIMLKTCGVSKEHYDKHCHEVMQNRHMDKNKELIDGLTSAFDVAKKIMAMI